MRVCVLQGVPRCVLQLVAVGCIFLASKQLEVHHPTVEQMVQVAANSFTQGDLLRVERILLDALEFNVMGPTAYAFLHLLTQATISLTSSDLGSRSNSPLAAAAAAAAAASCPPMEVVVSLAMYLTELALLDQTCLVFPGSHLATAALLLAHTTLSGHYQVCAVAAAVIYSSLGSRVRHQRAPCSTAQPLPSLRNCAAAAPCESNATQRLTSPAAPCCLLPACPVPSDRRGP